MQTGIKSGSALFPCPAPAHPGTAKKRIAKTRITKKSISLLQLSINWIINDQQNEDFCDLSDVSINSEIDFILPNWRMDESVTDENAENWYTFLGNTPTPGGKPPIWLLFKIRWNFNKGGMF